MFAAFSLGTAVVGLRESSTIPTAAVPRNERDDRNLSVTELSLTSRGGGPREQASLLARPESAMCTRTGRGKKEKLPAIFTVAGGCGPVPPIKFWRLSRNSADFSFLWGQKWSFLRPRNSELENPKETYQSFFRTRANFLPR